MRCKVNKGDDRTSRLPCYLLFPKVRDIFQTAVQRGTQFVESFGLDIVVCPQAAYGLAVDTAPLAQGVGRYTAFFHRAP